MERKGCIIFDPTEFATMTADLQLAQCMLKGRSPPLDPYNLSDNVSRQLEDLVVSDAHSCSCCSVKFPNPTAQRAHFKLDWHRYNIKRQLAGLTAISEESFVSLADKGDDIESISGSESESEEEAEGGDSSTKDDTSSRHAKVFFRNKEGQVVSLYRCLLFSSKDYPETESFVNSALQVAHNDKWAVIMLGGGHFAAAVFKGQEPIVHKTFHCYTVRAKQGGSQSTRDNKGRGHPKSAGASLRRYNEQALIQHVQELVSAWEDHLKTCNLIFYRAVGPHNRSVLFGGKIPPLDKTDARLRTIPFPTRRATYNEVKRVHGMLSFMEMHGLESEFQSNYPPAPERKFILAKEEKSPSKNSDNEVDKESSPRRAKSKGGVKPNRAKSRPSPQRPLPAEVPCTSSESEAVSGCEMTLTSEDVEIKFKDNVTDFDGLVKNQMKKKKEKSKPREVPVYDSRSKEEKEQEENEKVLEAERKKKIAEKRARKLAMASLRKKQEEEEAARNPTLIFHKELLAALQSGDVVKLQSCLSSEFLQNLPAELPGGLEQSLNLPILDGNTPLHIASKSNEPLLISELMASGADPSVWNKKSQPPYVVATCKEVRKAFQDFRLQQPDKFDYSGIPLPLTEEEESKIAERKAALRKAKREKDKEKQKLKAEQRAEQEERARFSAMSDREKRALAAERRMLAAQRRGTGHDSTKIVVSRCYLCAIDVTGQATFDYDQFRFCTIECLKAHRKKNNESLSVS